MTRPGLFAYLFGNPVAILASLALLGWAGYEMYLGQCNFIPVVIAGLIAARCWSLGSQLQAYSRWQKGWDAMNGKRPGLAIFHRLPWLRWPAAITLWLGVSYVAMAYLTGRRHDLAVLWFGIGSVVFVAFGLFRLWQKRPKRTKAEKWEDVSTLVAKPGLSADARGTVSILPDYCRQLLS